MDKFADECRIIAISQKGNMQVSRTAFFGLSGIQHRGEESAGLAVCNNGVISCYKEMGLVSEVFDKRTISLLKGDMCLGHVKYSNARENFSVNAQPMVLNYKKGNMAVAFNGALVNGVELRNQMEDDGFIFSTRSDCELIAALIARNNKGDISAAIIKTMQTIRGAYAIGIMTDHEIIAVRDFHGIRPLAYGKVNGGYVLASEDCAIDIMDGQFIRDVRPGEILIIDGDTVRSIDAADKPVRRAGCIFEHLYFARPDSTIDGINVYHSREIAGRILAKESPARADYIIGVPDSGTPAAIGFAMGSGIPYTAGLVKNKYVGRTFIQPTQSQREMGVKIKLNPITHTISGKSVVLVDDSIVRGTTMRKLIQIMKNAGVREVHLRISSPPVYNSCYFGVDTPDKRDLIANSHTIEEICRSLGADSLAFISIGGLIESVGGDRNAFCAACFTGEYPEV